MKKAFTLIELLVVIAIIAILAAILFPVFAQAKLAAKKSVALSNAKQVALATQIYMGDYDDALIKEYYGFPASSAGPWGGPYYSWRYVLQTYLAKSNGLLADPTNIYAPEVYWQKTYSPSSTDTNPVVYQPQNFAVNGHVIGFANGPSAGLTSGLDSMSLVEAPADTIQLVPNRTTWQDLRVVHVTQNWPVASWNSDSDTSWYVKNRSGSVVGPGANKGTVHANGKQVAFVFLDGHAKGMAINQTIYPTDRWMSGYTDAQRATVGAYIYPEYK